MKKFILLLSFILWSVFAIAQNTKTDSLKQQSGTFVAGNKTFLLNGKPFVIRAGELHYPRIPRAYWDNRIKMCKAMGLNTICIYLFWNFHEQEQGKFDFKGQADIAEFVKLIQKNGMYCILRPGPYVCAEWDMGGLPWWLLKKPDLKVRTLKDSLYMARAKIFLNEAGKQLAPLQIQNGGNIIMVQVENEYGAFGKDAEYMATMRNIVRAAGFNKVQLVRCDWSSNFNSYKLDGVATAMNFGAGSNIDEQFTLFRKIYPDAPLVCGEYWTGWFDYWGRPHETRTVSSFIGSLKDMMDRKISFSLYMAHGGTTFGPFGGANSPPYQTNVASYDYNAPINEGGQATDKFYAVRNLLKNYLNDGEQLPDVPANLPVIKITAIHFNETAGLFANLPKPTFSKEMKPMEMFNQGWGAILYSTKLKANANRSKLIINELHDWATIYINHKKIGTISRQAGQNSIELPPITKVSKLDILVDGMGRVNFGETIIDRKGITKKVNLVNGTDSTTLSNWMVYNLPASYGFAKTHKFVKSTAVGAAWHKGTFNIATLGDSYLDMTDWGKGMVWVNGHNLGRFWHIGPQQTLYLPGCWLKKGENEIIVFDVQGTGSTTIAGLDTPILDKI
jgi:beta-galactosidase